MSSIVILGGGIAGISAGYHASLLGHHATVYEARERYGGLTDHFEIEGFRFDSAIHLSFTQDAYVRSIFDQTDYLTHKPVMYNFEEDKWLKHPVQNNLYPLPAADKLEAIKSFLSRPELTNSSNYKDWLIQQYGHYISERYPMKYTDKYWTVPADQLSTDWIGNRMYRPTLDEVLLGAFSDITPDTYYAKEMRYPQLGGYRAFLNPMVSKTDIRLNKRVTWIDTRAKTVEFADGKKVYYDNLLSTLPLPELVALIKDAPATVRELSQTLWATSVALVSLGFNRPDVTNHLWFYMYDKAILASRAYAPNLKSPDNVPEGCSSLQFEIYFSRYKPLSMSYDNLIEHTIDSVEKMRLAYRNEIIISDCRVLKYGNVVYDHGMIERRETLKNHLKALGISLAGRFGEWDYFWSDQSLMSGKRAAEQIVY